MKRILIFTLIGVLVIGIYKVAEWIVIPRRTLPVLEVSLRGRPDFRLGASTQETSPNGVPPAMETGVVRKTATGAGDRSKEILVPVVAELQRKPVSRPNGVPELAIETRPIQPFDLASPTPDPNRNGILNGANSHNTKGLVRSPECP